MSQQEQLSLTAFTETTKKVCMCSAISIFLIVLFIISPLSKFLITSILMKIIIIILLSYTIYLNYQQTNYLRNASQLNISKDISSQLTINIICSYTFILFLSLLIIFILKTFF
jgi:hypothetical protein